MERCPASSICCRAAGRRASGSDQPRSPGGCRLGLRAERLAETVETCFQWRVGLQVSKISAPTMSSCASTMPLGIGRNDRIHAGRHAGRGASPHQSGRRSAASTRGPNTINRENVQRRIIVQANVAGRDLGALIDESARRSRDMSPAEGYFVQYGGQFEAQEEAARQILCCRVAHRRHFPAALSGPGLGAAGVARHGEPAAGADRRRDHGFLSGGSLSVASLVGFITLFGIATRNGIMLITHYQHLIEEEGVAFRESIVQGSLERLSPILMTALVTGVGLIPLALGGAARQRDPAAHGRGDPGGNRHLDFPEHDCDPDAVSEVRRPRPRSRRREVAP